MKLLPENVLFENEMGIAVTFNEELLQHAMDLVMVPSIYYENSSTSLYSPKVLM